MKVYIVTGEPFPNGLAATNRIKCYALALMKQGVDIEVLIFRRTEGANLILGNKKGIGVFEGIHYRYIGKTSIRSKNPFVWRVVEKMDHLRTILYLKNNLKNNDVVLFYCGFQLELTLQIIKYTRKTGAKYIRDLCELPFGTGKETPERVKQRNKTYTKLLPQLDGVISISDAISELARKYMPKEKILKVPILVDFDKYKLDDLSSESKVPFIFHSGTLYEQKDGVLGMLEAFGLAVKKLDKPLNFVLTGTKSKSPHVKEIDAIISKYQLQDKVIFTGYLSNEDLKSYLSKASLVIINKYETQQNQYCFSTKLGEYLAAAKPLVITKVGEAMNWLKDGKSAYIVSPHDIDALSSCIVEIINNLEKSKQIGLNGQQVCKESFDYRIWGKVITDFLEKII